MHRSQVREDLGRYLAEGPHLCRELASARHQVDVVVLRDDATQDHVDIAQKLVQRGAQAYACGARDMALISESQSPQSILASAAFHSERPLGTRAIALDAVSDPGNVGTIIRCAAWFGFTDVVLGEQCADVYNPKTMRATVGAALRVNVIRQRKLDAWIASLDKRPIIAAVPRGGELPSALSELNSFLIIIGSETHGIRDSIMKQCSHYLSIPGLGETESLNAAMAAAIICYEARRT